MITLFPTSELKVRGRLHIVVKGDVSALHEITIFVKTCIISCYSSLSGSVVSFQAGDGDGKERAAI